MKRTFVTNAAAALALCGGALASAQDKALPAGPAALEGDWMGQLDTGAMKLRLILHGHGDRGGINATLDSPDQNATGMPATVRVAVGSGTRFANDRSIQRHPSSRIPKW